jgi:hypothetical protein
LTAIYEAKPNTLGAIKRSHDQMENAASTVGGWVYIGSANFSPSAWGTISRDEGEPLMNVSAGLTSGTDFRSTITKWALSSLYLAKVLKELHRNLSLTNALLDAMPRTMSLGIKS